MKFAYNADVEIGQCIFDYISDENDLKKAKKNYDKALKGQANITRELYGDINAKTYETYYSPMFDQDDNIIGISVFSRDISELIDTVKELENEKLTAQKYLDIAGVMMLLLDKNGDIQLINKKGCSILNTEKNKIIGKNWFNNFIPEKNRKEITKIFMNVVSQKDNEDTLDYENTIIDINGNEKSIYWHNAKLSDVDGNTLGILSSGEDVTERKNILENLKRSEKRFRALFEKAPFGYQSLDKNGYFLDVNDKWLEIFEYNKDEIIGTWFGNLLLDDAKLMFKNRFKVFKERGYVHSEFPMKTGSGKIIDIAFDGNIAYDNNRHVVRTHCTLNDVTELNIANDKLKSSKKKLSMILSSVEEAVYGLDLNGCCTFINKRFIEMLGYEESEVIGKNIHELIHHSYADGSDFPENKCPMTRALKKGGKIRIESDYIWKKNGEKIPVEYSSNPLYESDELTGAVVTFKDISEKIKYLEELKYAGYHDYLTGLNNRRYYELYLNELDNSDAYPFAILNFDVNGLKMFNDVYGHSTGDEVLKATSKVLSSTLPRDSIIVRLSGDEFAALILNANEDKVAEMKNKISETVSKIKIKNINLSIAAGSYIKSDDLINIEEAQKLAEDDMLKDKISENSSYRSHAIQAIFNTLTNKYDEEKIHSQYVSSLSVSIGRALGLDKKQIKLLKMAALYHDIGKISIPDSVLKKPGKLTDEEYEIIKTHTEIGYQILNTADQYSDLAKHALYHHERWDGKGYPRGLKEDEIPLFSRIISLADSYQAMTSDRVYRKKMSEEEAIKEVIRCSGSQFDPNIAKVFIEKALNKQWREFMS